MLLTLAAEELCSELDRADGAQKDLPQLTSLICVASHLAAAVAAAPAPRGAALLSQDNSWPPPEWQPGGAVSRACRAAVERAKDKLKDRDPSRVYSPHAAMHFDVLADAPLDEGVRGRLGAPQRTRNTDTTTNSLPPQACYLLVRLPHAQV